ncbi:DUF6660 family protein [Sediminibacterium roseum]|uniref:DUF6660 family protein n=1 Tax=Sediminibacterium roseum TaxID=1978412 RepID=UPI003743D4B7
MRITVFILTFIVLGLSLLPCADRGNAMKAGKANTEITAQTNHEENQGNNDLCPPFCHCGCCANVFIKTSFLSLEMPPQIYINKIPSYLPGDITGISLPIWQPPQLIA